MKRAALLAGGLLALGACDRERQEPWFVYANGNLQCSGGGSSVKTNVKAIEAASDSIGSLVEVFQDSSSPEDFNGTNGATDQTEPAFEKAAKACGDFLARVRVKDPNTENGQQ
ncbi:MAG: hypothetical protein OXD36_15345 [Rhodobacter sp.]|nr:hypothetical protein [Rhodobacter sp.]